MVSFYFRILGGNLAHIVSSTGTDSSIRGVSYKPATGMRNCGALGLPFLGAAIAPPASRLAIARTEIVVFIVFWVVRGLMVNELGMTQAQGLKLVENSFTSSFLSEELIAAYMVQLNDYMAAHPL